jgi:hypothetical protein
VATVTALPVRTSARPARPVRVASTPDRRTAGLVGIAAQLEEAFQRGRASVFAEAEVASRPRHLSAVPAGGAS